MVPAAIGGRGGSLLMRALARQLVLIHESFTQ